MPCAESKVAKFMPSVWTSMFLHAGIITVESPENAVYALSLDNTGAGAFTLIPNGTNMALLETTRPLDYEQQPIYTVTVKAKHSSREAFHSFVVKVGVA